MGIPGVYSVHEYSHARRDMIWELSGGWICILWVKGMRISQLSYYLWKDCRRQGNYLYFLVALVAPRLSQTGGRFKKFWVEISLSTVKLVRRKGKGYQNENILFVDLSLLQLRAEECHLNTKKQCQLFLLFPNLITPFPYFLMSFPYPFCPSFLHRFRALSSRMVSYMTPVNPLISFSYVLSDF